MSRGVVSDSTRVADDAQGRLRACATLLRGARRVVQTPSRILDDAGASVQHAVAAEALSGDARLVVAGRVHGRQTGRVGHETGAVVGLAVAAGAVVEDVVERVGHDDGAVLVVVLVGAELTGRELGAQARGGVFVAHGGRAAAVDGGLGTGSAARDGADRE
ncbi:uncharacterized protein PG986_007930 [Apiospora aurea]|uniref:Uncharacterized protein n=1 Tax=Apiospora aurea TaxID=335848 RepID=A0ABR1QE99_9PEZI